MHWLGRTGKTSTRVEGEWKIIAQTGALRYGDGRDTASPG